MNTHSIDSFCVSSNSIMERVNGLNPHNQFHGVGITSRVNKYFILKCSVDPGMKIDSQPPLIIISHPIQIRNIMPQTKTRSV